MAGTRKPDRREQLAALAAAVSPRTLQKVLRGDANVRPLSVARVRRELEELLWKRGDEEATYPALDGARLAEFIPAEKKPVVAYPDEPLRVVVYRMALSYGRLPIHALLLAGVILNAIFSAMIMFVTSIMEPNRSVGTMTWLMGTLTAPSYPALAILACYLLGGLFLLLRQARRLNVLTLGEESARSLGIDTEHVKRVVYVLSALITGAVVSVSGMIGFVGMVIPHAVRFLLGADHRLLLPASACIGGMYLVSADTLARTLLTPTEIPVGIVTALAGGPFFIYLLVWRKDRFA